MKFDKTLEEIANAYKELTGQEPPQVLDQIVERAIKAWNDASYNDNLARTLMQLGQLIRTNQPIPHFWAGVLKEAADKIERQNVEIRNLRNTITSLQ